MPLVRRAIPRRIGDRSPVDWEGDGDIQVRNVTSRSKTSDRELSPFFLGPVQVPGFEEPAQNLENAWQYSKVYPVHIASDGSPTKDWYDWAKKGFAQTRAVRYPMGKGSYPQYLFWAGKRLNYVSARKAVYVPLYIQLVQQHPVFKQLKAILPFLERLFILDFDVPKGYVDFQSAVNNNKVKVGHGCVLAALLNREIPEDCQTPLVESPTETDCTKQPNTEDSE